MAHVLVQVRIFELEHCERLALLALVRDLERVALLDEVVQLDLLTAREPRALGVKLGGELALERALLPARAAERAGRDAIA
jgi:hypothetical protein